MIFNGQANMGKTEFCNALARHLATRKKKPTYGFGAIDKYGAVTRANQMYGMGCFVFDDFRLETRGGTHRLSIEEVKHLLYVKQRGTVHAFYGDAIFPEGVPRVWSINYKNADEPESWFERENLNGRTEGLLRLQLGDASYFNDPATSEETIAVARRAMIFLVNRTLFSQESVALHNSDLVTIVREAEARCGVPLPDC